MMVPKSTDVKNKNADEKNIEKILSKIEGVGKVSVMISYGENEKGKSEKAVGAVAVADGADTTVIKNRVSEAMQAALDLPAHKVKVYKSIKE